MKNHIVNKKLKLLYRAKNKYHALLKEIEEEIKRRHGYTPSDVDFEEFIDTYHYSENKEMTIQEIDEGMVHCIENVDRLDFRADRLDF